MTVWSHIAKIGTPGGFQLFADGADAGDLTLEHPHASVLAGHVVAALNEFEQTMSGDEVARFRAKGWATPAAYQAEVDVNRLFVLALPAAVREQVAAARDAAGYGSPLTPAEMAEFQETIQQIISAYEEAAA